MTRLFRKSDRVRLTPEAAAKAAPLLHRRQSKRGEVGTVMQDQNEAGRVRVLWDGLKTPVHQDAAVLELVKE